MNQGKRFEEDFKNSVPDHVLIYRIPDSAQSFGTNDKLRFSRKNPFDYLVWDSVKHNLYAFELKTVNGISISFERSSDDAGIIHHHQIQGLIKWKKYGVICGFIVNFRSAGVTVFIEISSFIYLMEHTNKKSISLNDIRNLNNGYTIIPQKICRTRYKYDVALFLDTIDTSFDNLHTLEDHKHE